MNKALCELLVEQLSEALEVLEDVDDGGEGRGVIRAALKTARKLHSETVKASSESMGILHPSGVRESS